MSSTPSARATAQYASTADNLTARIALHSYGTNPQSWFSWLDERLPLRGDVLEVGAGTGELWRHVDHAGRGLRLTLTDSSPAMCERLAEIAGARVLRCDAERLPFPDACFDTVIANHMLYHLDDPNAAVRQFARVLRPGGVVAAAVNGDDHLAELNRLAAQIGRPDLALLAGQNDVTARTGPAYLQRHFPSVDAQRYPCDLEVSAVEPILAYLSSMADQPLTSEQLTAAREAVQARIEAEGAFRIRKHTVLMIARR